MVEFPITQMPGVKFPVYATVMFTAGLPAFDVQFACVRQARFLTYVFHSFDLFGEDDPGFTPVLRRYLALRFPLAKRLEMVDRAIGAIARRFVTVTYRQVVTTPALRDAIFR